MNLTSPLCVITFALTGAANAGVIITDLVEGDGWIKTGQHSGFNTGYGLADPIAGTKVGLFASQIHTTYSKSWSDVYLTAGEFTVSVWLHDFSNSSWPTAITPMLTAGGTNLSASLVTSSLPTPGSGQWVEWTLNYTIAENHANIGGAIGFKIERQAGPGNAAWDSLNISLGSSNAVPGPAAAMILVAGAGLARRRRR